MFGYILETHSNVFLDVFQIVKNVRQSSRTFSMPQVDNVTWMICRQKKHFFIHFPSHS